MEEITKTHDDVINEEIEQEHASMQNLARIVSAGSTTQVLVLDRRGNGGANHLYVIDSMATVGENETPDRFACVTFQNGAIQENGINGCHNEDLIAIVIDRLQGFQSGEFACRENALAITKLEEALMWLNKRTNDRIKRGVEGKSIV